MLIVQNMTKIKKKKKAEPISTIHILEQSCDRDLPKVFPSTSASLEVGVRNGNII